MFLDRKTIRTRFSIDLPHEQMCNALYAAMLAETSSRGHTFVHDDTTKDHIVKVADWLIDPGKKPGLLMMGKVGNGKTTLAKAIGSVIDLLTEMEFGYNAHPKVQFHTAKEICRIMARESRESGQNKGRKSDFDKLCDEKMLIIDDLGVEPKELLLFGQPETPLMDLLSRRYDKQLFTIVTTNLGKTSLNDKYEERMYDRMCEWLQPIPFTNESYRQQI